jgi:hypothetical protein
MKKLIFSIGASLFLTACAGLAIDSLKRDDTEFSITIEEKILQTSSKQNGWIDGLMPAKYTAIGSNKKGTYYLGENYSKIEIPGGTEKELRCSGGFFVPFDASKNMHFFNIIGSCITKEEMDLAALNQTAINITNNYNATGTAVGGLGAVVGMGVAGAMIAAEQGKILWARDIEDKKIIELIRGKVKR